MAYIASITGRVIGDSRGQPTVEVTATDDQGHIATASLANGRSLGKYEAKTVEAESAVTTINTVITPALLRFPLADQRQLDLKLASFDSTPRREKIGVNATLAISLAGARLLAQGQKIPLYHLLYNLSGGPGYRLPTPMFNCINGGSHARNNLDFQEFLIIPQVGKAFWEKLAAGKKVFAALGALLGERHLERKSGDEGGYAPNLATNEEGLGLLVEAITKAGYEPGREISLGLDVAAASLPATYPATPANYLTLFRNFPLLTIEDPFPEDAWKKWQELRRLLASLSSGGHDHLLIGDDLFVTNHAKLEEGIRQEAANAVLIKPSQAASLTEILDCIALARQANYVHIISHRSGETLDTFVSDLAIGTAAPFLKAGAPNEQAAQRIVKYERVVQVEEELMVFDR